MIPGLELFSVLYALACTPGLLVVLTLALVGWFE